MAWTLSEIVARLGGGLHGEDRLIARLAPLDEAGADKGTLSPAPSTPTRCAPRPLAR
ncbi:MAG: hypothetical protein U1E47_04115 [Rivihabitans pingtungensis]